jgi:predicted lipid carrier protein YhbT
MRDDHGGPFPLPVGLSGLILRPVAAVLLQPVLDATMAAMVRRHGAVFDRLGPQAGAVFLIDPVDLPIRFLLRAGPSRPSLTVAAQADAACATAAIRGPVLALIDLLEGRIDGDALFFSRELHLEGDTEAVVALRNAVDGEEIEVLDDVLSLLGPLADPLKVLARAAGNVLDGVSRDLEIIAGAFTTPARRRRGDAAAPSAPRAPAPTTVLPASGREAPTTVLSGPAGGE